MIHKVNVTIDLELMGLSRSEVYKLINKINNDNGQLSFEELDKMFMVSGRKFYVRSMELPEMQSEKYDLSMKFTKIEISA